MAGRTMAVGGNCPASSTSSERLRTSDPIRKVGLGPEVSYLPRTVRRRPYPQGPKNRSSHHPTALSGDHSVDLGGAVTDRRALAGLRSRAAAVPASPPAFGIISRGMHDHPDRHAPAPTADLNTRDASSLGIDSRSR